MSKPSQFFVSAGPLLLVIFIDGMGLGLIIPILNDLIFGSTAFLPPSLTTPTMHHIIYGVVIGIFMFSWFFGAAILGDLSDKIGRKKSLLICLTGAFLSYVLSAIAVLAHSLTLLILGRVIAGFTSGSQPIAQAAIVDLSEPEDKTRNIGYILLALSLGFIIGPLLGGVLADNRIVSWFNFAVPFYFAATVSLINVGLLWWLFKETFVSKSTTFSVNPYQAINIFISAFKNIKVRNLSLLYFLFIFGWSSFYSFVSMYLLNVYDFSPTQVSLFMAVMGIGFGFGNGYLSNYMAKRLPLRTNFILANSLAAIMILLMVTLQSPLFDWIIMAPLASWISVAYASILTMFSNQVDENSQGWVMGITGAVMAFVWGVNGIVIGILAALSNTVPIFISGIFLLFTAVSTLILFKPMKN